MTLAAILLVALLASLVANRLMIAIGPRLGLMDQPDPRRVHVVPIPRAGGLAVWLVFASSVLILRFLHPEGWILTAWPSLQAFLVPSALLMAIGVIDDRQGMRASVKLAGQVVAALIYWFMKPGSGSSLMGFEAHWAVDLSLWVMWIVLLINAFNLIDGLDGLCAGLVVISLSFGALLQWTSGNGGAAFLLALMGVCLLGFLFYNRNPARIFLGDAGSMTMGFFLATFATQMVGRKALGVSLLLPLAVAGVPLLDVILAIWRRSVRNLLSKWSGGDRIGVFSPDKDHLHHRLLARGLNQRQVTRVMHGLAVGLSFLALCPILLGAPGVAVLILGIFILALFGMRHLASVELVQSGLLVHFAVKRTGGPAGWRATYVASDLIVLMTAAAAAIGIETNLGAQPLAAGVATRFSVVFCLISVATLCGMRIYRRVWSRAGMREFVLVALSIACAGGVTAALLQLAASELDWRSARLGAIASVVSVLGILGPRAVPDLMRELAVDSGHRQSRRTSASSRRVLVFGAGDLGNLYIDHLKSIPRDYFQEVQVVGFVDDNPRLRGRLVRGFEVLGGFSELRELCSRLRIDVIILAISQFEESAHRNLLKMARELGIVVLEWNCSVRESVVPENCVSQEAVA